jgi:hypothetical protein
MAKLLINEMKAIVINLLIRGIRDAQSQESMLEIIADVLTELVPEQCRLRWKTVPEDDDK